MFDEFCGCLNEADVALIADVYAAGEAPIEGADRDALVRGLEGHGHKCARGLDRLEDLPALIADIAEPGDYVICLGAGDITRHANELAGKLEGLN